MLPQAIRSKCVPRCGNGKRAPAGLIDASRREWYTAPGAPDALDARAQR